MGIRDEIAEFSFKKGPRCNVGIFLETLQKPEATEIRALMADQAYTHSAFSRWALKKREYKVSSESFSRHRKGECACGTL